MKNTAVAIGILLLHLVQAQAQKLSTSNQPSESTSRVKLSPSPTLFGVFLGRTPCQELMNELKLNITAACAKRKIGLTLHKDAVTGEPTTYKITGMGEWSGGGRWHILAGSEADPGAVIFKLDVDANRYLLLLKGDDNVLFMLDRNRNFLIGNAAYSYTLNRVKG